MCYNYSKASVCFYLNYNRLIWNVHQGIAYVHMHIRLKKIKGGRRRRKPCVQQCVYRRVCLLFQCNISELRRSGSTHCCSDSAGQRGHWKHHKKLPLSVCLQKQQFRLERKKHFPSWLKNIQKRPRPFFFSDRSPSFGMRKAGAMLHIHTNSSSAAEIWLWPIWLHRSQSVRICGIAASSLPQMRSLPPNPAKSVWFQQISPESTARGYYIQSLVRQICFYLNYTLTDPPACSLSSLTPLPLSAHMIWLCVIKYYTQITHKTVLYRLQ